MPVDQPLATPWLMRGTPAGRRRLRLLCFPCAGRGASAFQSWATALPGIELCAVQLPGRESRILERPFTRMDDLVPVLFRSIAPCLAEPFAMFGHSLGALVAFELARYLRARMRSGPEIVIVCAHAAPQLPRTRQPMHDLPETDLIAQVCAMNHQRRHAFDNAELVELAVPLLRADFAMCETYHYRAGPPLACPIAVFGGADDHDVPAESLAAWRAQTSAGFALRMLPGDHFCVETAAPLLRRLILADLQPWIGTSASHVPRDNALC